MDQVERQLSGAASRVAADAAADGPATGQTAAAAATENGAADASGTAATEQPELVMLGPAKGVGDEGSKPASGSGRNIEEL